MGWLADLDRGLFDLAFPRDCAVTLEPMDEGERPHLSAAGADLLPRIHDPRCLTCGHPFEGILEGDRACPHCLDLRPAFARAVCAFRARGPARRIIHRIKYEGCPFLADDLAHAALSDDIFRRHLAGSVLVPVPLHADRRSERGYNQAERIAACLAAQVPGCRAELLLRKRHETTSQTRLGRQERRKNVAGAFVIAEGKSVDPSARYVVIDDVLTTGATLHACALALRKAGAEYVDASALCHG
ncbi:MAG: ComF family protein [Verrucomicrobiota bacterium]